MYPILKNAGPQKIPGPNKRQVYEVYSVETPPAFNQENAVWFMTSLPFHSTQISIDMWRYVGLTLSVGGGGGGGYRYRYWNRYRCKKSKNMS